MHLCIQSPGSSSCAIFFFFFFQNFVQRKKIHVSAESPFKDVGISRFIRTPGAATSSGIIVFIIVMWRHWLHRRQATPSQTAWCLQRLKTGSCLTFGYWFNFILINKAAWQKYAHIFRPSLNCLAFSRRSLTALVYHGGALRNWKCNHLSRSDGRVFISSRAPTAALAPNRYLVVLQE